MGANDKNDWVRDGLSRRGYRQKDLAVAWSSQNSSVSRFFKGMELQDPPLSKAVSLARMLGITVDALAKGLGQNGVIIEPHIEGVVASAMPLGHLNITQPERGVVRIEMRKDFDPDTAQKLLGTIMSSARLDGSEE